MNRLHWLLICSLGISYLPTVSIGIDTHGSEGERYLYLPSVFWIFLLSTFLSELPEKAARNVFGCLLFTYCFLLSSAASNYGEASKAARNLLSATSGYSGDGKIIAVNIPSNYKGALIFRSGFSEANHWFYPGITDSIIAFPAGRTYERIRSVDTVSLEDLRNHGVVFFDSTRNSWSVHYNNDSIPFVPERDLLIYYNRLQEGMAVYPSRPGN